MTQIEDVIVSSITELIRVFVILEYLRPFQVLCKLQKLI